MIVMGIESSCDETAVSLVERKKNKNFVRSEIVLSQIPKHRKFGGVVPEISSREHLKYLDKIVRKILCKSKTSINEIDENPLSWWNSNELISVRNKFHEHYCNYKDNQKWKNFFTNLV